VKSKPLTQALIAFSVMSHFACTPEETDPAPEPRNVPGAAIWFDSSVRAQIMHHSSYDTWGGAVPPPDSIRYTCLKRETLDAAELDALANVRLTPIEDNCSADGFSYTEITVWDANGSVATYRDTGCHSLRVAGATTMLDARSVNAQLATGEEGPCEHVSAEGPRDVVGAGVWFDTSTAVDLRFYSWTYTGEPEGSTVERCWKLQRAQLTKKQSEALTLLTLHELDPSCTVDGTSYLEVSIHDRDGSIAQYRNTGCQYDALPNAKLMLSPNVENDFLSLFGATEGVSCTEKPAD
jgi:hypothetical protein